MNRRTATASIVLIAVVAFTVVLAGSLQVQAKRAAVSLSRASDDACLTPTPGGIAPMSWVVLEDLERPVYGIASHYVVTNQTTFTATTMHSYCDAEQNLVGSDAGEIPPEWGQMWDLASTDAVSEGYSGYAIVRSDQLITGAVLSFDYDLGVELEPDHSSRVAPGRSVLYDHLLTNSGTITDTYSVDVLSSQEWPVALLSEGHIAPTEVLTVELGPNVSMSLQVSLTVPSDAAGITEVTVLTATSQLSPTVQDTATDTTVVAHTVCLPLTMKRWPPVPFASHLNPIDNADQDNSYAVSWQQANLANTYVLEEATNASFSDARVVYQGAALSWSTPSPGKTPNTYYYRVKARNSWGDSPWSNVQAVEVYPLFVGLELRWDGKGYIRGDWYYDIGWHQTKQVVALVDADTVQIHNYNWYDPNPADLESEEWDSYYSVSTGYRRSSSLPSDPSWKWGYPRVLPYDWEFRPGQTFRVDGQSFAVSGPHSGYTAFGQPVQYWRLVNKDRFLIWDGGGDWKQYVHAGDAELHYDVGPTRVLLYSDVLRTEYHKGDRTNNTIHYVVNLTSASAFAAQEGSAVSYFSDRLPTGPHILRGLSPMAPPEGSQFLAHGRWAPAIAP